MNKHLTLLSISDGKYDYQWVEPSDFRASEVRLLHEIEHVEVPVPMERPDELPSPTFDNLLITGDSLHALDALSKMPEYSSRFAGQIKLVYIDPPFNTGKIFTNYADDMTNSIWLTMLRDRLRQVAPLLHEDASVWVHLDDNQIHRCRLVMDEELGHENFIASIAWEKAQGARNDTDISSAHDHILVYAAKKKSRFKQTRNLLTRSLAQLARYQNPDNDPNGPWRQGDNGTAKSGDPDKNRFPITLPSGRVVQPKLGSYWRFTEASFAAARAANEVYFGQDGDGLPLIKRYLSRVQEGVVPRTWWPATEVGSNQEAKRDHVGKMFPDLEPFSTPKPERLLQRIIHLSTNPGDLVLDFFAGSGTTAAVAHKMGRRWIAVELLPETVDAYTKPRLLKVLNNEDDGGITVSTARVEADGVELPEGVEVADAQRFQTVLKKVLDEPGSQPLTVNLPYELARVVRAAKKAHQAAPSATRPSTTSVKHMSSRFAPA